MTSTDEIHDAVVVLKDAPELKEGSRVRVEVESAAREFGRIKAETRKAESTIPDADLQIAAIARMNDLLVLNADRHFSHIANLRTENWTQ